MGLFDNAVRVILNDKVVNRIELVDGGVLYERALPRESTSLSIDVPLNLVYGDSFNITGTLLDSEDSGVSGATVKLKVGSTVVDTVVTGNDGVYSFTHSPVRVGNHSFQVVYSGDSSYRGCDSAVVNRVVDRETSVISVSPSTVYVSGSGDSVSVSGSLVDDDGSVLSGASVSLLVDGTVSSSTTTDGSGAYTFTFNYPDNNSHVFKVRYDGDSNYTASEMVFNVIVSAPDSMTVSKLYDTVSLHGSPNTNILSATVLDANLSPCGAVEVVFSVGGVDISVLTDGNGVANYSYTAQSVSGTGEVSVVVSCGSLVETCNFYDVLFFDSANNNASLYALNDCVHGSSSTSTLVFDTNHYILSGTGYHFSGISFDEIENQDNIEISFDFKLTQNNPYNQLCVMIANAKQNNDYTTEGFRIRGDKLFQEFMFHAESTKYTHNIGYTDDYYHIVFKRQGTLLSADLYKGDVLLVSDSYSTSLSLTNVYYVIWNMTERGSSYSTLLKNIKVIEL